MLPVSGAIGLTYQDLHAFPDDNVRRELIGGELIVAASPTTQYQSVVVSLLMPLWTYGRDHGGEAFPPSRPSSR